MLRLQNVHKTYGERAVLAGVELVLAPAERLVIRGGSGAGKSTLLRIVAGLELPEAGELHLDGRLITRSGWALPPNRRGMGFVFQSPALWPHMTVRRNILFGLHGMKRDAARKRADELLETIGLSGLADRFPDQLSGGEARRASIARSLAPGPRLLLLDEPLTHLDSDLKETMLELLLQAAAKEGTALIYVTHDRDEAERVGSRCLRLEGGVLYPD